MAAMAEAATAVVAAALPAVCHVAAPPSGHLASSRWLAGTSCTPRGALRRHVPRGLGRLSSGAWELPRGTPGRSGGWGSRSRGRRVRAMVTVEAERERQVAGSEERVSRKERRGGGGSGDRAGASSVSSGVRLEHVSKTFKNVQVQAPTRRDL